MNIDPDFVLDLERSRAKYPVPDRMLDGLMGEVTELRRAYAEGGDIRAEAFDVAACAYRIATEGDLGGNTTLPLDPADAAPLQEARCRESAAYLQAAIPSMKDRLPGAPESMARHTDASYRLAEAAQLLTDFADRLYAERMGLTRDELQTQRDWLLGVVGAWGYGNNADLLDRIAVQLAIRDRASPTPEPGT